VIPQTCLEIVNIPNNKVTVNRKLARLKGHPIAWESAWHGDFQVSQATQLQG